MSARKRKAKRMIVTRGGPPGCRRRGRRLSTRTRRIRIESGDRARRRRPRRAPAGPVRRQYARSARRRAIPAGKQTGMRRATPTRRERSARFGDPRIRHGLEALVSKHSHGLRAPATIQQRVVAAGVRSELATARHPRRPSPATARTAATHANQTASPASSRLRVTHAVSIARTASVRVRRPVDAQEHAPKRNLGARSKRRADTFYVRPDAGATGGQ